MPNKTKIGIKSGMPFILIHFLCISPDTSDAMIKITTPAYMIPVGKNNDNGRKMSTVTGKSFRAKEGIML